MNVIFGKLQGLIQYLAVQVELAVCGHKCGHLQGHGGCAVGRQAAGMDKYLWTVYGLCKANLRYAVMILNICLGWGLACCVSGQALLLHFASASLLSQVWCPTWWSS